MSLPGAFAANSDSDSDASFISGRLAHLEGIAAMSSDDDPDFGPASSDDNEDDDTDDAGDAADPDGAGASDGDSDDGGAHDDRPQLRIGLNPITRSVMLIDDDGTARPLTGADLAGTNVSLTMIRNMLLRNLGAGARRSGRAARYDDEEDDEMDDEDADEDWGSRRSTKQYYPIIEVPQENGMRLERGGAFGPPPRKYDTTKRRNWLHAPTAADYFRSRELDFRRPFKDALGDLMLPNSSGVEVAQFAEPVYSGQYSADGTFFYAACKDYRVYMYDTSTAPRVGDKSVTDQAEPRSLRRYWSHRTSLKVQKIAQGSAANCSWTLTDAELSDDNQWLIYSSITPRVHMVRTGQGGEWGADDGEQHTLDFAAGAHYGFGIWSVRFSHDAREIVAGARSGLVLVYDVEAQRTTLRVRAHQDDTNAVAFASASDSNLLVSGSDDCFVKVWDRRSLDGERPSGTCVGHTEGVTFVAPKGDGRYILSNGKDQGMKLWDLRMMMGDHDFERLRLDRKSFSIHDFDYRYGRYAKPRFVTHPHDVSVMTYRGHAVLRTLIRCHFSPVATTGQRYVYTGSADGRIHIYSLDGRIVQVLDRAQAHPLLDRVTGAYADPSELRLRAAGRTGRTRYMPPTVRDVSWHPFEPKMMSTAWEDAGDVEGSIALHEWAGTGEALEDRVERAALEARG
ncbi:hypothetical protein JCM3770_003214 [Rhodotorula araucariae]